MPINNNDLPVNGELKLRLRIPKKLVTISTNFIKRIMNPLVVL